jgi:hypothetical protein
MREGWEIIDEWLNNNNKKKKMVGSGVDMVQCIRDRVGRWELLVGVYCYAGLEVAWAARSCRIWERGVGKTCLHCSSRSICSPSTVLVFCTSWQTLTVVLQIVSVNHKNLPYYLFYKPQVFKKKNHYIGDCNVSH